MRTRFAAGKLKPEPTTSDHQLLSLTVFVVVGHENDCDPLQAAYRRFPAGLEWHRGLRAIFTAVTGLKDARGRYGARHGGSGGLVANRLF